MVPGFQEDVSQQQALQKAQVTETARPVKGYSQNWYIINSTIFYWSKQSQIQGDIEGNSTYQVHSTEDTGDGIYYFSHLWKIQSVKGSIKHNAILGELLCN